MAPDDRSSRRVQKNRPKLRSDPGLHGCRRGDAMTTVSLADIIAQYRSGTLPRGDFWRTMRDRHLALRDYHALRSEEHTSELQSLMRISYAVFCLKNKHSPTR